MFVGVDGCRVGWIAVAIDERSRAESGVFPSIDALWTAYDHAQRIMIDIPIGLSDDDLRECERLARQMLGSRRSSVFSVPIRAAFNAKDYTEASAINQRITGKKLSKQTYNIMSKIREVDDFLRRTLSAQAKFYEMHPEVAFTALAGHPMPYSKKHSLGFMARLNILKRYIPDAERVIQHIYDAHARKLEPDDVVDALVGAVAAKLGNLRSLPENPIRDRFGLPMRIVYPEVVTMPSIQRINHVQITIPVGAEAAGRAFYCGVLNLPEVKKPESLQNRGGFWLQLGDQQVHVGVEDGFDRQTTKGHIAYEVDDITYWRERLENEGISIGESVPIPGFERFEFRDPFGNRVEIIQPQ